MTICLKLWHLEKNAAFIAVQVGWFKGHLIPTVRIICANTYHAKHEWPSAEKYQTLKVKFAFITDKAGTGDTSCVSDKLAMWRYHVLYHGNSNLCIKYKAMLSTGVYWMLVGNRIGVGLTRSTLKSKHPFYSQLREFLKTLRMAVVRTGQPPWLRLRWKLLSTSVGFCSNFS